jgi:hypothetical protein
MALGCGLTSVRGATEEKITKMNRWFAKTYKEKTF